MREQSPTVGAPASWRASGASAGRQERRGRARRARPHPDPRRARAQPARDRRRVSARRPGGGHRRLGLGQVDAGRGRPLRHLAPVARLRRRRGRALRRAPRLRPDLADLSLVDQGPIGRSSRSNPVTYIKAYDDLRRIYSGAEEARRRGITPAHFSFNVEAGRCPAVPGDRRARGRHAVHGAGRGALRRLPGAALPPRGPGGPPSRPGHRRRRSSSPSTRRSTSSRANARWCASSTPLAEVGLGYLRLGQPTSTLSGGEAQRLKLATFLGRPTRAGRQLFLFDEPTTGLHLADIDLLYRTLRRLVQRGDGVVVVEHNLDFLARVDWIVDLGPGRRHARRRPALLRPVRDLPRRGRVARPRGCSGLRSPGAGPSRLRVQSRRVQPPAGEEPRGHLEPGEPGEPDRLADFRGGAGQGADRAPARRIGDRAQPQLRRADRRDDREPAARDLRRRAGQGAAARSRIEQRHLRQRRAGGRRDPARRRRSRRGRRGRARAAHAARRSGRPRRRRGW